ncbi:sensor histidine kinase [Nocardioides sp. LML1-1-1.1]|uniref:sensor histidine kinase n=1 Tax=Nocardioides sp. LML1-1-1.1 TaxID=3135248 RepID=UPI00343EFD1C
MRRRLLVLTIAVIGVLLAALLVPSVVSDAAARTDDLHERRLAAATRLAALAGDASTEQQVRALEPDLRRFHDVYDADVLVLDADGTVLARSGTGSGTGSDAGVDAAVAAALDGNPTTAPDPVWPWDTDPMVIATPIGRDAQVLGAVVVVQPTDDVRRAVAWRLGVVVALGLAALAVVALLVALPLVGWILRPVRDLESSARQLGEGDTSARVPGAGPPELRRLAATFNTMAESVEVSQRQQRDLVADVSHQLANPVTALRLRLEALAEERAGDDLGAAIEETDRIARALEGLIEVSSAGSRDRERGEVDLVAQVRERIGLWEPLFGDLLAVDLAPAPASVVVEPDLAPVVVDALLDNALKYAPGVPVELGLRADGDDWLLVVRDHGPELSDAEADDLGRRFHRLPRHAAIEGTGLGLAIAAGRLRDAGGSLRLTAAGPGLRAEVRIPRGPGA